MEVRSFLAFELPDEIKDILRKTSREMKKIRLDLRWVKVENIHLTVIFMGNMAVNVLDEMDRSIREVCSRYQPFNICLKGAGIFFTRRTPRVLWIGLDGDMKGMNFYRDDLQRQLSPFGVQQEKRKFNPHLTLGRFRKGAQSENRLDRLMETYQELTSQNWSLQELVLFKSDLTPGGAVYTRLNSWNLNSE